VLGRESPCFCSVTALQGLLMPCTTLAPEQHIAHGPTCRALDDVQDAGSAMWGVRCRAGQGTGLLQPAHV